MQMQIQGAAHVLAVLFFAGLNEAVGSALQDGRIAANDAKVTASISKPVDDAKAMPSPRWPRAHAVFEATKVPQGKDVAEPKTAPAVAKKDDGAAKDEAAKLWATDVQKVEKTAVRAAAIKEEVSAAVGEAVKLASATVSQKRAEEAASAYKSLWGDLAGPDAAEETIGKAATKLAEHAKASKAKDPCLGKVDSEAKKVRAKATAKSMKDASTKVIAVKKKEVKDVVAQAKGSKESGKAKDPVTKAVYSIRNGAVANKEKAVVMSKAKSKQAAKDAVAKLVAQADAVARAAKASANATAALKVTAKAIAGVVEDSLEAASAKEQIDKAVKKVSKAAKVARGDTAARASSLENAPSGLKDPNGPVAMKHAHQNVDKKSGKVAATKAASSEDTAAGQSLIPSGLKKAVHATAPKDAAVKLHAEAVGLAWADKQAQDTSEDDAMTKHNFEVRATGLKLAADKAAAEGLRSLDQSRLGKKAHASEEVFKFETAKAVSAGQKKADAIISREFTPAMDAQKRIPNAAGHYKKSVTSEAGKAEKTIRAAEEATKEAEEAARAAGSAKLAAQKEAAEALAVSEAAEAKLKAAAEAAADAKVKMEDAAEEEEEAASNTAVDTKDISLAKMASKAAQSNPRFMAGQDPSATRNPSIFSYIGAALGKMFQW